MNVYILKLTMIEYSKPMTELTENRLKEFPVYLQIKQVAVVSSFFLERLDRIESRVPNQI